MFRQFLLLAALLASVQTLSAREWKDASGKFHQEAELVEFDGNLVVLKKAEGQLVAIPLDQLSKADQEYLKSKHATDDVAGAASKDPSWVLVDGSKFKGKLLKFGKKDLVFSRKLGELYVNGKPFAGLPALRQHVLPMLVGQEEGKEIKTASQIDDLIAARKGADLAYQMKGAVFEIEAGENVAVPISLLSDKDRKVIEPQWNAWVEAEKDVKFGERQQLEQSTIARALFNEHLRNGSIDHRLQSFQSELQWSQNTPGTWQIRLRRPDNSITTTNVSASDEMAARASAQQQYPHSTIISWNRL